MLKRKIGSGGGTRALLRYVFYYRWHGKWWSSSKQRFVTSRWVFFVRRWAMARSKATDEYIPNLTPKNFFACGSPESRKGSDVTGAMWEVRIHHKRLFWDIESSVARTETSDGALESQWWVELKSDLKKNFSHPDLAITGVEVTSQPGLSYTTIPHLAVS